MFGGSESWGIGVGEVRGVRCLGVKDSGSWGVWRGFKEVGVRYLGVQGWG